MSVEILSYDHYGLTMLEIDGCEYAVATSDSDADDAAKQYIEDILWAFNAEFIIQHSALPWEAVEMVKNFQQEKCEDANDTIRAMISDIDDFVSDAIAADGRGHFLSPYNGNETELRQMDEEIWDEVLEALDLDRDSLNDVLLYRVN